MLIGQIPLSVRKLHQSSQKESGAPRRCQNDQSDLILVVARPPMLFRSLFLRPHRRVELDMCIKCRKALDRPISEFSHGLPLNREKEKGPQIQLVMPCGPAAGARASPLRGLGFRVGKERHPDGRFTRGQLWPGLIRGRDFIYEYLIEGLNEVKRRDLRVLGGSESTRGELA